MHRVLCILLIPAMLAGCDRNSPDSKSAASQPASISSAQDSAIQDLVKSAGRPAVDKEPAPARPSSSPHGAMPSPQPRNSGGLAPVAGPDNPLKFETPAGWREQQPTRAMRRAEYVLPKADGDADDALLVITYFGPGGAGTVDQNITRWRGMFKTDAGEPLPDDAVAVEKLEAGGMPITVVDLAGRFTQSAMMPGAPPSSPRDNHRMLAAIIETTEGSWFLRADGPANTIAAHRDRFMQFVKSVKR